MAPLARGTLWRLREAALGTAAFTETFAGGRAGSRGECFGTCALLYMMLVRYCTRCLYATVQGACTLLYKVLVRYCTRCLYATVQGACTLLYKVLVQIECMYPVVGANDYSPLQNRGNPFPASGEAPYPMACRQRLIVNLESFGGLIALPRASIFARIQSKKR